MAAAYGITVRYMESVRGYIDATRYRTSGRFNRLNNTVVVRPAVPPVDVRMSSLNTHVSRKQMLGSPGRSGQYPSVSMALFTADNRRQ